MNAAQLWQRYQRYLCRVPALGLTLDVSRMGFDDGFVTRMSPALAAAFAGMEALEKGAIANPDENRMVGHYWLRAPSLAPTPEIRRDIEQTLQAIKAFAARVHTGQVLGEQGAFRHLLVIGIGGSAPGPQFVAHALGYPK